MDAHTLRVLEFERIKEILLRYTGADITRELIAQLAPSSDRTRLALSLCQVDEARALLDRAKDLPARGLRDMAALLKASRSGNRALEPEEFLAIQEMLEACRDMRSFYLAEADRAIELGKLAERLLDHEALLEDIVRVIERPAGVRDQASPRLAQIRARLADLEAKIRSTMAELAQGGRFGKALQERSYSLRNGRFVLPVKKDARGNVPGLLLDKSASGETVFIEPSEVTPLANEMADLEVDERREVARILLELTQKARAEEKRLVYTQQVAAWLDFTAARARMSFDLGFSSAQIAEGPVIRLRGARHPVLVQKRREKSLDHDVVPLDVALGEDYRMIVITGPNTGGKTVALKTLGLIQLMFQAGLHVPAAPGSLLPVLQGLHADIGDEQSLAQSLSTFSGHVQKIVQILEAAGPEHLVLLDELGAGTDPLEGAALGEAILDGLRARGALAMVTTHLGSLKTYAFTRSEAENASVTFDTETLSPTYQLVVGRPGASQALHIARRHGMPQSVIEAARALLGDSRGETDELVEMLSASRVEAEELRVKALNFEAASREELVQARRAREEAEASRARIEAEAEHELQRLFDDFRKAIRPHMNALKNVPKSLLPAVQGVEEELASGLQTKALAARRREFVMGLKKHDQVYVPRYATLCRIERIDRALERLTVRMGQVAMEIPWDDVSWVTPPGLQP